MAGLAVLVVQFFPAAMEAASDFTGLAIFTFCRVRARDHLPSVIQMPSVERRPRRLTAHGEVSFHVAKFKRLNVRLISVEKGCSGLHFPAFLFSRNNS